MTFTEVTYPASWNRPVSAPDGDMLYSVFDNDGTTAWVFQYRNPGFGRLTINTNSYVFQGRIFNDTSSDQSVYPQEYNSRVFFLQDSSNNYYMMNSVGEALSHTNLYKLQATGSGSSSDFGNSYLTTVTKLDVGQYASGAGINTRDFKVWDVGGTTYIAWIGSGNTDALYVVNATTMTFVGKYTYSTSLTFGLSVFVDNFGSVWGATHTLGSGGTLHLIKWNPTDGVTGTNLNVTTHDFTTATLGVVNQIDGCVIYIPSTHRCMFVNRASSNTGGDCVVIDLTSYTVVNTRLTDNDFIYPYNQVSMGSPAVQPDGSLAVQGGTNGGSQNGGKLHLINPDALTLTTSYDITGTALTVGGLTPPPLDTGKYAAFESMPYNSTTKKAMIAFAFLGTSGNASPMYIVDFNAVAISTTTGLSTPDPIHVGASVTLTATVTPASGAGPTGTVQFKDGATNIGSPVTLTAGPSTSTATLSWTFSSLGIHSLSAVYTPNTGWTTSTGTASPTVEGVFTVAPTALVFSAAFGGGLDPNPQSVLVNFSPASFSTDHSILSGSWNSTTIALPYTAGADTFNVGDVVRIGNAAYFAGNNDTFAVILNPSGTVQQAVVGPTAYPAVTYSNPFLIPAGTTGLTITWNGGTSAGHNATIAKQTTTQAFTVTTDQPWLSATASGTAPMNISVSCTLGVLAAGIYTGNVIIHGTGVFNSPLSIPVVFNVTTGLFVGGFALIASYQATGDTDLPPAVTLFTIPTTGLAGQSVDLIWQSLNVAQVRITGNNHVDPPLDTGLLTTSGAGVYLVEAGYNWDIDLTIRGYDANGVYLGVSHTVTYTVPHAANVPPVIDSFTFVPSSPDTSTSVTFLHAEHDPDGEGISTVVIDFGDGSPTQTIGIGANVSHTYTTANTYTATLTVTDFHGGVTTATQSVTVTPTYITITSFSIDNLTPTPPANITVSHAETALSGVAYVEIYRNNVLAATVANNAAQSFPTAGANGQTWVFFIRVYDNTSHSKDSGTITVNVQP